MMIGKDVTIINRLKHMENGHKENGMRYEAEVCFRAIERIEKLEAWKTWADDDAITRNKTNQDLRKRIEELEVDTENLIKAHNEMSEQAQKRITKLQAQVEANILAGDALQHQRDELKAQLDETQLNCDDHENAHKTSDEWRPHWQTKAGELQARLDKVCEICESRLGSIAYTDAILDIYKAAIGEVEK